ncbi:MAG TPA: DUF1858 domain-containing protein [Deinococcales bacterium]|nr:DUF1858 domain-containing protein [Deinococcales bacterium]
MKSILQTADERRRTAAAAQQSGLLDRKVAAIIAAHPGALDVLIEGGFGPLANPVARKALAHTVTLRQAFAIRGLDEDAREAVTGRLLALGTGTEGGGDAAPEAT